MSSLKAFINPPQAENREIVVSNRFQEDGKPVPFIIRAITQDENQLIMKKTTKTDKKGNATRDMMEYTATLVASAVVFPDLTNAELQKAYGVLGEVSLLRKMLLIGEYANLSIAVQELAGLDIDINEDIEEVKNV